MSDKEQNISTGAYIGIWAALIVLTGVTVWVAGLHLGNLSTITALAIATVKTTLVLLFFMHLRYERPLFIIMLFAPIVTLATIIGLTFVDVWFR